MSRIKAKVILGLLVISGLVAAMAATAGVGEGIPEVLTIQLTGIDKTYPSWVSSRVAARPDGTLDTGLFHPVLLRGLESALRTPPDPVRGCVPVSEFFEDWVSPPDVSSLDGTFRSAQRVLRARVVERDFGFDRGTPGQAFKVEPLETFKGKEELPFYYFFVPVGRFKVGKVEICKTDYRFPNIPEVGEEVVLLVPKVAQNDPWLDLPFHQGLIVLRGTSAMLPGFENSKATAVLPRTELLAELAAKAKSRE